MVLISEKWFPSRETN
uniref:Uncharacterized protein n=1 Tax=Anguilla anguilla TaxID=7936 RepID=A0A0E9VWA2_ANGAN